MLPAGSPSLVDVSSKTVCVPSLYVNDAQSVHSNLSNLTPSSFTDFDVTWPDSQDIAPLSSVITSILQHPISSANLRRAGRKFILTSIDSRPARFCKAHMPDPVAMCSSRILTWGRKTLNDCPLRPDNILESHLSHCKDCSINCYIYRLVNVARYGWSLPMKTRLNLTSRSSNHVRFQMFDPASSTALETQILSSSACEPLVNRLSNTLKSCVFHPLLTVIKSTDIWRASELGIQLDSAIALQHANALLTASIKLRICLDTSCTGLNDSQPDFPFAYTGLDDAIAIMFPNCWMAKIDLKDMFHSLGLAYDSRRFFCFRDSQGQPYRYRRAPFGGKLFPAVLSAFMSEVCAVANARGIALVTYVDDFLIVGASYQACKQAQDIVVEILESHGWTINMTKLTLPAQQVTFLGIDLDSVRMTLTISPDRARVVLHKLHRLRALLSSESAAAIQLVESLAGNFVWFSGVITTGRIYNRLMFNCWRDLHASAVVYSHVRSQLEEPLRFWESTLESWSKGELLSTNVKILSSRDIEDSLFLQCDAGDEGHGYYVARVRDGFRRLHWYARLPVSTAITSSTWKELYTIVWALEDHPEWRDCVLTLVFDSSAAAFALDSGSSASVDCHELIKTIYLLCDVANIHPVALWVPREHNQFADHLTHYCMLHRYASASGVVDGL